MTETAHNCDIWSQNLHIWSQNLHSNLQEAAADDIYNIYI